jgi:hypothetical protein
MAGAKGLALLTGHVAVGGSFLLFSLKGANVPGYF